MKEIEYKGAKITHGIFGGYEWIHDDYYDADWTGDGWSTFGGGHELTIEDCKNAIDEMFKELNNEA